MLGSSFLRGLGFFACLIVLVLGGLPVYAQSNDVAESERLFRQCVAERTAVACDTIVSKYSGWTQTPRWALARVHVQRALFLERDGDFIGAYKELQTAQTVKFSREARRFMARLEKKMSQTRRNAGNAGTGNKGSIAVAPPPSRSAASERADQIVQRAKRAESRKTRQVARRAKPATRPTKVPLPVSRLAALGPAKRIAPKDVASTPVGAPARVADPRGVPQSTPGGSIAGISQPVPSVVPRDAGVKQAASEVVMAEVRKDAAKTSKRSSQDERPPSLAMSDWIDIMGRSAAGAGLVTDTGRVVADGDRGGLPAVVSSTQNGAAETALSSPLRVTSDLGQRRVVWSVDSGADRCGLQGPDGVRVGGLSGTIVVNRPARGGLYRLQCFKGKRLVTDVAVTAPFTPSAPAIAKRAVEPAPNAQIEATQVADGAAVVSSPAIMPSTGQPVVAMIDQVDDQCKRTLERSKPSDRRVRMSARDDDYSVARGMTLSWLAGPLLSDCRAGAEGSLKPVSNRGTLSGMPIGDANRTYRIVCQLCDGATRSAQVSGTALKGKAIVTIRPLPRVDPFEPRGRNWLVPVLATVFGMGVLAIALRRREETVELPATPERKTFAAGSRPKPVIDDAPALRPLFVRVSEVPLEKIPPMPSDEELAREDLAAKRAELPDLASPESEAEEATFAIPKADEIVEPAPDAVSDPDDGTVLGRPALYANVVRGPKQTHKAEWRAQYQASSTAVEPDGVGEDAPVDAITAESENQLSDVMDEPNRAPDSDETAEAEQPLAASEASPVSDVDFLDDPSLFDDHDSNARGADIDADFLRHAPPSDGASMDRVTDDTAMTDILVEPTAYSSGLDETISLKDLQDHEIDENDQLPEHGLRGLAPEISTVVSRPVEPVHQETPLSELARAPEPEPLPSTEPEPLPSSEPEPLPRLTDDEAHGLIAVLRDGDSLRGQSAKGGSVGLVADLLVVSQRAEQADGEPVSYEAFLRLFGVGELASALSHESVQITDEPSGFDLASLANAIERSHITAQSAAFADAFALLVCQRVFVGASLPVSESVHRTLFSSVRELLWEEPSMRFATGGFGAAKTIIRASRQAHGRDRQPGDDEDLHMAVRSVTSFAEMFDIELVRFGTAVEGLLSAILQPVQGRSMALGDGSLVCPVPLTYLASDSQDYLRSVVRTLFADGAKLASPLLATKRAVRKRIETAGVGRPISGRADLLTIEHFDDTALGQLLLVPFDMPLALLATRPVVWVADAVAAQRSDIMRDLVSGGADAETHAFVWDQGGDLAAAMAAKRSVELIGLDRADGASAGGLMNFMTLHSGFVPGDGADPIDPGLFAAIYGELLQAALVGHGHPPHLTKHQRAMLHVCLRLAAQYENPTVAGLVSLLNGKPDKRSFRPDATAALATDVKRLKACFKGVPRTERIALTSRIEGLFRQPLFAELFSVDGGQTFSDLIATKSIVVFEDPDAGTDFRQFGLILSRMISRRHPAGIDVRESNGAEVPTVRDGWDGRLPAYHGRLVVGVTQLTGAEDEHRDLVIAHGSLPEGASGDSNVSGHRAMAVSHIRDPETGNWLPLYRKAR